MANRTRTNRNEVYLSDDEQYILNEKFQLSKMKSKADFLRKLILYGYVQNLQYRAWTNQFQSESNYKANKQHKPYLSGRYG